MLHFGYLQVVIACLGSSIIAAPFAMFLKPFNWVHTNIDTYGSMGSPSNIVFYFAFGFWISLLARRFHGGGIATHLLAGMCYAGIEFCFDVILFLMMKSPYDFVQAVSNIGSLRIVQWIIMATLAFLLILGVPMIRRRQFSKLGLALLEFGLELNLVFMTSTAFVIGIAAIIWLLYKNKNFDLSILYQLLIIFQNLFLGLFLVITCRQEKLLPLP